MQIMIHIGINQIGGCITEIATDSTRILIDLGQNLPDKNGNTVDKFASKEAVKELTTGVDAILYTHYHGDHVGLMTFVDENVEQYIGAMAKEVIAIKAKYLKKDAATLTKIQTFQMKDKIKIGDIVITPFLVSHSAADAYMFLIEVRDKKILHTGDFRDHGYIGKRFQDVIKYYVKEVDFLITEDTMLSRSSEQVATESELKTRFAKVMAKYKYVFVLGSSTDMDRLASLHKTNPNGRKFVCDRYQKDILDIFTANAGSYSDLYKFDDILLFPKAEMLENEMKPFGFCMLVRVNKYNGKYSLFTQQTIREIPDYERVLIYSMWDGYLDNPAHQNDSYLEFIKKFSNIERIHTSGHATIECISELCRLTNPRMGIIPIHSERSADFLKLPISKAHLSKVILDSTTIGDVEIILPN